MLTGKDLKLIHAALGALTFDDVVTGGFKLEDWKSTRSKIDMLLREYELNTLPKKDWTDDELINTYKLIQKAEVEGRIHPSVSNYFIKHRHEVHYEMMKRISDYREKRKRTSEGNDILSSLDLNEPETN